jgi:hypothetical protein
MLRHITLISLILWTTCSTAAVQSSDFWFHNDGDTVFIDGARGAPLHIDYIGAALIKTKTLKVRVTPKNPYLKVSPSTCTFTKDDHDCRLIVRLKERGRKVYGVTQFDVAEVGEAVNRGLTAKATIDTGSVGFEVGVQNGNMPAPVPWNTWYAWPLGGSGKVVLVNATNVERQYIGVITGAQLYSNYQTANLSTPTYTISLPSKTLCYVDEYIPNPPLPSDYTPIYVVDKLYQTGYGRLFSDVTNPADPIFNAAYQTGNNNLSTCSENGQLNCASNKWASWTMGLANLGAKDMPGGVRAGQVEVIQNGSWDSGSTIYYEAAWTGSNLALLLIQGSTDGTGFDAKSVAPNVVEIKSAAPCSSFVN